MICSNAIFAGGRRLLPALVLLLVSAASFAHGTHHHHYASAETTGEERQLRKAFKQSPTPETAVRLGRYLLEHFRTTGDSRKLANAQHLLEAWPPAAAPHNVNLLRADLHQAAHEFPEALALYRSLTADDPKALQPWLNLAAVSLVVGKLDEAEAACKAMLLLDAVVSGLCIANVMAQTNPDGARQFIEAQIAGGAAARSGVVTWAHTLAGDAAHRGGALDAAQFHYERALEQEKAATLYLRLAHADVLLDQGEGQATLARLRGAPETLGVLIRRGRALKQIGASAELSELLVELRHRLDELEHHGPEGHERELALAAHYLFEDAPAARRWAARNWKFQREWIDARLLKET